MMLVSTPLSPAQETRATLGGKVFDAAGRVIPGAAVTVTTEETGGQQTTTTNEAGNWRVQSLLPGHYHFEVRAQGFKAAQRSAIELQIADQKFIDVTLNLGSITEKITVDVTPPLIDTTSAVSGTVITTAELQELPTPSASPMSFAGLTPGVTVDRSPGQLWANIANSNQNVNGAGVTNKSINYQIDGAPDTKADGQIAFVPPKDSVSELRVVTNAYDAAIGRQGGGTINLSTKSGSSDFHGTLYENNQNNFLNANRFENRPPTPVAPVHINEYGVAVGGPVWIPKILDGRKKQTFFFFGYDRILNKAPASRSFMSIPTMLERQGDFSQSFTTTTTGSVTTRFPIKLYDPARVSGDSRLPFKDQNGNDTTTVIPPDRISPIAKAILALMPPPDNAGDGANSDSNNYLKRTVQDDKFASYALRLDQAWNNAHHSYVSLRHNTWNELSFDPFGPGNLLQGLYQTRVNHGLTMDHTWVVSPKLVLDLRYNITAWDGASFNTGAGVDPTNYGFPASFVALQQPPSIPLFQGLVSGAETGGLGTNQKNYDNNRNQAITGGVTQTRGNHIFRYGAEFMIEHLGTAGFGQAGGVFNFGNNWTTQNIIGSNGTGVGSNLASFLLGLPTSGSIPTTATAFWSQHYAAVYFQDDWRTTKNLTINLGLRWDYELPYSERYDRYYFRFDPTLNLAQVTGPAQNNYATLISGPSNNVGIQLLQHYRSDPSTFVARGGHLYAGQNGASRYIINPRYKYFQPRLGFAYRLRKNTVIRGGLGRFVQATNWQGSQDGFASSTPFNATTDNFHTWVNTLGNPFPDGKNAPTGNSLGSLTNIGSTPTSFENNSLPGFVDPDIGRPYVDEASFHVQQQLKDFLFEIGGTLNMTHALGVAYRTNLPSLEVWQAAFGPAFDATGKPLDPRPGDVPVANPFKGVLGAPYFTGNLVRVDNVSAYSLLRPNPLFGDLGELRATGKSTYYAVQSRVERRFKNGFGLLQSFTWSKQMTETGFRTQQIVSKQLRRQLDGNDRKFQYVLNSTYVLPFGRGKYFGNNVGNGLDRLIGGWELTGIYNFASGQPVTLPTNSSFFQGSDPFLGSNKTSQKWFDTSKFVPFPTNSTTLAQLQAYPSWTGVQNLPGYTNCPLYPNGNCVYQDFATWVSDNTTVFGSIRTPYLNEFRLGLRKNIPLTERVRVQLRMDAFNALNHPRFGGPGTNPSSSFFGVIGGSSNLTQVNDPRAIQLGGKIYF